MLHLHVTLIHLLVTLHVTFTFTSSYVRVVMPHVLDANCKLEHERV